MRRIIIMSVCACLATIAVMAGTSVAKPGSASAGKVSGLDKQSLKTSMEGDLFEIRGGKLALSRSHTKVVRALGQRLITDHTKAYNDSAKLAKKLGIDVETSPSPSEVWELRVLTAFRGHAFDSWYTSLEVYDHRQDIQETTDEIQDGSNREVVADAKQDLPVLREHLRLSEHAFAVVSKK